jgi:hypothetical protein
MKNANIGRTDILRNRCRGGVRVILGLKSPCDDSLHGMSPLCRSSTSAGQEVRLLSSTKKL